MSKTERTLRYIGPNHDPCDRIDHAFESFFASLGKIEVSGWENIPKDGPLVVGYLPHSGWIGAFVINYLIRKVRSPPVWATRKETFNQVPHILLGDRGYLFLNREYPGKDFFETTSQILNHPLGSVATAFEGTRTGNSNDLDDLKTLAKAHLGIVKIATLGNAPILPVLVLGENLIIPQPEKIPPMGVIFELARAKLRREKPNIQVKFLPVYTNHLDPDYVQWSWLNRKAHLQVHTDQIMRSAIRELLVLDRGYPIGENTVLFEKRIN